MRAKVYIIKVKAKLEFDAVTLKTNQCPLDLYINISAYSILDHSENPDLVF